MRKLLAVILLLTATDTIAQYATIRHPQELQEITLFRSLGVLGQLERIQAEGGLQTTRARAFDSSGRIVADMHAKSSKYYLYNEFGQVTAFRDTTISRDNARSGQEYIFVYRDDFPPVLSSAVFPRGTAQFTYDAKNNMLVESGSYNDTAWTSYYYYDDQFRPRIIYHYSNNKLTHTDKREYGPGSILFTEMAVDHFADGSDSVSIVYQYNENKQLMKKVAFHYSKVLRTDDNGKNPVLAEQYYSETIDYKYNDKGQLVSEDYNHSLNKFAHKFITYTYDDRGLKSSTTITEGSAKPVTYVYEYGFFEKE